MVNLTQMDSGSYTFRRKDNTTDGYGHSIDVIVWVNVGIAAGVFMLVVLCCCCLKRCCCKKSSKSSDPDPANLQQYSAEPSRPGYSVDPLPPANPGYAYAYQPANLAPSVEMHSPASVPFTAAQVPAAKRQSDAPAVLSDSNFLFSDTNPQFEMKGMSLVAPLHSESTFADVYTSDKLDLNFL
ncbi:unnamed protein product [Merluccius merluccius]